MSTAMASISEMRSKLEQEMVGHIFNMLKFLHLNGHIFNLLKFLHLNGGVT